MTYTESDFGAYLQRVDERDIDLLLMEEFHVSPDFVTWFCERVGLKDIEFGGAWHSLTDEDGETDVLLRVRSGDTRMAVLIENKIAAPEQPEQDARYHLRGARARVAGHFDKFITCMCAPAAYLAGLKPGSRYEHRISYEAIRDWYAGKQDARHAWRWQIMEEAVQQGRRGYTMVVNSAKSNFHHQYWEYLQRKHPTIVMRRPTAKGGKSDWIYLRSFDMPRGVRIVHKNDQGCVDLTFGRTTVAQLLALKKDWPTGARVMQKEGSAVLSIQVSKMDMTVGVAAQEASVEEAVTAAYRLIPFCRMLKAEN